MVASREKIVTTLYHKLYQAFGPQNWWPARTRFEVIVGAILTQNTNWRNVERAISHLRKNRLLNPTAINKLTTRQLAESIKPAGFFNVKARRLKNFISLLYAKYDGRISLMARGQTADLRKELLAVNGIGPETADSILLYAFDRPVFVVDAYTKRILLRHGIVQDSSDYDSLQALMMVSLPKKVQMFNEYHALIVQCAKNYCRTKPRCEGCPLECLNRLAAYRKFAYQGL